MGFVFLSGFPPFSFTVETVRGCVSLKKYKSQGKAVEVTVNNNFCLDFVQEFSLWRRGPCARTCSLWHESWRWGDFFIISCWYIKAQVLWPMHDHDLHHLCCLGWTRIKRQQTLVGLLIYNLYEKKRPPLFIAPHCPMRVTFIFSYSTRRDSRRVSQ